jgi:Rhodopsin-like GPCR transmembrane domain
VHCYAYASDGIGLKVLKLLSSLWHVSSEMILNGVLIMSAMGWTATKLAS